MVLKPGPIFEAVETIWPERNPERQKVILLSAQGVRFSQPAASRLARLAEILLICGRYEGVDERVSQYLADQELSIGDYVLSGGELAAAVVIDTVARLLPGVLGNEASGVFESFGSGGVEQGILDCPHYTRPADFRGWRAPEALLAGDQAAVEEWRRRAAQEKTRRVRPELMERH
jgi:tRNA (guanine37-N1)-methyltransferase